MCLPVVHHVVWVFCAFCRLSAEAVFASDEDKTDNEIIEHELLRLSTRELTEMIASLCIEPPILNSSKKVSSHIIV